MGDGCPPSDEGVLLWRSFTKDVRPLKNQEEKVQFLPPPVIRARSQKPAVQQERWQGGFLPLGEEVRPPLSLGRRQRRRIQVEAVLDLHGMTQQAAVPILVRFLETSSAQKNRCVLVITGKGRASPSILKRLVVSLLSSPACKPLVRGFAEASPKDGGSGALYIFLKIGLLAQ